MKEQDMMVLYLLPGVFTGSVMKEQDMMVLYLLQGVCTVVL